MRQIAKGAEANLYKDDGKLVKKRISKKYRIAELDKRLRKARTKHEAKILEKLSRIGVSVPKVIGVNEKEYTITMEFIDGKLIKDVFNSNGGNIPELSKDIGKILAKIHDSNIIHNDLTTSNMILKEGDIYFIDLGLGYHSTRVEDMAMDLVVFKKSVRATHPKNFEVIWEGMLAGYKGSKEILTRVEHIEKRVRYA